MKDRLVYLLVRGAIGIFGLFPARIARRLGEIGGQLWYWGAGTRKVMVRRHMARVTPAEPDLEVAASDVFKSYGRYWAETFWVRPRRFSEINAGLSIEGLEHLKAAAEAGRGAVVALPHLGNWETAALSGPQAGIGLVAVAEKLANPLITDWFTGLRQAFGIEILLNDRGVMRDVEEAVKAGKAVCLLADRDLKGRGVETNFFGETTTLPAGPVALAGRTGAPLLTAACYFTPTGHHLVIYPPLQISEGTDRLVAGTQALAARLEEHIRSAPRQWHLLQPNWPSDRELKPHPSKGS